MNRSNEAEVSLLSDPEHIRHGERQYKDYGLDSAFLGRIVKEQVLLLYVLRATTDSANVRTCYI